MSRMRLREELRQLACRICEGKVLTAEEGRSLMEISDEDTDLLFPGADLLREARFGRAIHLCVICNGKSGRCSEDCSFCAQSGHARADTGAPEYPLLSVEALAAAGRRLEDTPVHRYSVVTSGKRLSVSETGRVAEALSRLDSSRIQTCASLGTLEAEALEQLRAAGVSRYHHNLETAASHFPAVCTTHTYDDRLRTLEAARQAGFSLCCGGVFGLGESPAQVVELGLVLREREVEAVPVNFLVPIPGTAAAGFSPLTPLQCLKIIAVFRYLLPDREIIVCGGRTQNLRELHPLVFSAGASGIMTGDYLTTTGRTLADDLALICRLGLTCRCVRPQA